MNTTQLVKVNVYELVREADAMGLSEKQAMIYIQASGESVGKGAYYKYRIRIKKRKKEALFHLAKNLPEVHIDQINSLKIVRKKLYMTFLTAKDSKDLTDLARAIAEIERQISDYNGWTQVITEDTLKKFGKKIEAEAEPTPIIFT